MRSCVQSFRVRLGLVLKSKILTMSNCTLSDCVSMHITHALMSVLKRGEGASCYLNSAHIKTLPQAGATSKLLSFWNTTNLQLQPWHVRMWYQTVYDIRQSVRVWQTWVFQHQNLLSAGFTLWYLQSPLVITLIRLHVNLSHDISLNWCSAWLHHTWFVQCTELSKYYVAPFFACVLWGLKSTVFQN